MIVLASMVAALFALIAAGLMYQWIGLRLDARRWPAPGRVLTLPAGLRLHVHAMGAGTPAVVFESGISASSLNWRRVQEAVAEHTMSVSYDRAGFGWSNPASTPRTLSNLAEELHDALRAEEHSRSVRPRRPLLRRPDCPALCAALAR